MPSSVIASYHYNADEHILEITFLSGRKYQYLDVPVSTYERMKNSLSKGTFLNGEIKGKFAFRRVNNHQ